MKILYTLFFTLLFSINCFATQWDITVSNFSFSPSQVNAVVGDVIRFNWQLGSHTTTCGSALPGTSLPAGANEWDEPMNAGNTSFSYTVTAVGTYVYGCVPHFAFNMKGTIIVSGTVPVALGMFNAGNSNNNNAVALTWKTFTESNTDHFSVRRSTDGNNFHEIAKVAAAGNSSTPQTYQFTDNNLGSQYKYIYYELVTVDMDQRQSFSEIKMVRNFRVTDKLIVALSPNPITRPGQVQIQFNGETKGFMNIKVFDINGKLMLKDKVAAFYGLNNTHLHVCDLPKGTYTLQFELDKKKEIRKIAVL
ncbi:MAG: T9SS type A sorting domain-containing protein [Ferruginibacter sp.]